MVAPQVILPNGVHVRPRFPNRVKPALDDHTTRFYMTLENTPIAAKRTKPNGTMAAWQTTRRLLPR